MAHKYNTPPSDPSTIGPQINTAYWHKKALIEAKKEMFFMPLADVTAMPKHFGKEIKVFHYLPLLDAQNVNDQGIDANGVQIVDGNLYGSSKDIGTIASKLPVLSETGGRVNRVGFTRKVITGSLTKFGFFTEFTQESLDFDTDSELYGHISREMVVGATQITEAVLQRDLLNGAGVVVYPGAATTPAQVTAEGAAPDIVDYDTLSRLNGILDNNRTPKQTKIISGSRMIDTATISGGRIAYVGSEVTPLLKRMEDYFENAAFVPTHKYADASTLLNGEIGAVDQLRFVEVPEMLHWAGVGAAVSTNPGYRATGGKYNVYPILVVGDGAFTTVGFQTDGKSTKFKITTKMPGKETADRLDPYGEMGFSSIKWYYGMMLLRTERIGVVKTVAPI
jgi:N4-gp56 family major capsid protein